MHVEEAQARVEAEERLVEHALVQVAHADQAVDRRPREHLRARPAGQLELVARHRGAAHLGRQQQDDGGEQHAARRQHDLEQRAEHRAAEHARGRADIVERYVGRAPRLRHELVKQVAGRQREARPR